MIDGDNDFVSRFPLVSDLGVKSSVQIATNVIYLTASMPEPVDECQQCACIEA